MEWVIAYVNRSKIRYIKQSNTQIALHMTYLKYPVVLKILHILLKKYPFININHQISKKIDHRTFQFLLHIKVHIIHIIQKNNQKIDTVHFFSTMTFLIQPRSICVWLVRWARLHKYSWTPNMKLFITFQILFS